MADKKFLDAMTKKFKEAPEEKTTTFYNMGGWKQSERKTAFVNEGKAIAEKRGIPMYNPDIGNPLGQRALMSYQLSGTDTFCNCRIKHCTQRTREKIRYGSYS